MGVNARRTKELLALLLVGDGVVAVLQPTRHTLLWRSGPTRYRRLMEAFVRRPQATRFVGALEVAAGVWWAGRQRAQ